LKVSIVAGGAGFVGANLLHSLLEEQRHVVVVDNLIRGRQDFYLGLHEEFQKRLSFYNIDLSKPDGSSEALSVAKRYGTVDEVWHLAANSDIYSGVLNPDIDFKNTFLTTYFLLEAMRQYDVATLHFSSSSAVYGDLGGRAISEDVGPLLPISNYGAMKLASEAIISAASVSYLSRANIFRFPNVVGVPATHGVILDFVRKLKNDPGRLDVLGDGTQKKCYLHVRDLINAMMHVRNCSAISKKLFPVNIGPVDEGVTVEFIAQSVVRRVSPQARILFGNGNSGWVGDVPRFHYSIKKLLGLGWEPRISSSEAILLAIEEIVAEEDTGIKRAIYSGA
jgi:UDP-glucose 4-epimerase